MSHIWTNLAAMLFACIVIFLLFMAMHPVAPPVPVIWRPVHTTVQ